MCFMFGASKEQVDRVLADEAEPVAEVTTGTAQDRPRDQGPRRTRAARAAGT